MKLKSREFVLLIAICCITLLEAIALLRGIDGQLFATCVGAISAMVGYLFGVTLNERGDRK